MKECQFIKEDFLLSKSFATDFTTKCLVSAIPGRFNNHYKFVGNFQSAIKLNCKNIFDDSESISSR
jgi:hypothetical protein